MRDTEPDVNSSNGLKRQNLADWTQEKGQAVGPWEQSVSFTSPSHYVLLSCLPTMVKSSLQWREGKKSFTLLSLVAFSMTGSTAEGISVDALGLCCPRQRMFPTSIYVMALYRAQPFCSADLGLVEVESRPFGLMWSLTEGRPHRIPLRNYKYHTSSQYSRVVLLISVQEKKTMQCCFRICLKSKGSHLF